MSSLMYSSLYIFLQVPIPQLYKHVHDIPKWLTTTIWFDHTFMKNFFIINT